MNTSLHIGFIDVFILCGTFIGILLSLVFILKSKRHKAFLYQGLVMLFLSFSMTEEFLNNTGYIVRVLAISNFAEPFNFTFAPLFYLSLRSTLKPENKEKQWHHFVPAMIWVLYMVFYFIQPNDLKYNSYVESKHPDWSYLHVPMIINEDPVGVRNYVNELTGLHFVLYIILGFRLIKTYVKDEGMKFFTSNELKITSVRSTFYHFILITIIFTFVKLYFGRDLGDMFISGYISFMIVSILLQVLLKSGYFNEIHSVLELPGYKYQKSSLTDDKLGGIAAKIEEEFTQNEFYTSNTASLKKLAKILNESPHHVSQVINQELKMSFFDLLAKHRIERAKDMLQNYEQKETIEEIAYQVGYNSKSSFNKAFKTIVGKTPTAFRKEHSV